MSEKHDYDGIRYREEKNAPVIFRILFYGIITWGIVFMGYFLFSGWSSEGEFLHKKKAKEELVAKNSAQAPPGAPAALVHREGKKDDYIAMGKAEYAARCAVCHGVDGKGGIGPDLTGKNFKYGKSEAALTETIAKGRPNGMPAFGNELSHEKMEGVVQYVLSLQ
ncbi:MAG: cytochrome c oxidase cbb3-type subunit [Geobacteraceae bacterium]|nr:MAG: cytochrome c oxidase cbb3-type subunit [Geobacteraceae bacterium]